MSVVVNFLLPSINSTRRFDNHLFNKNNDIEFSMKATFDSSTNYQTRTVHM